MRTRPVIAASLAALSLAACHKAAPKQVELGAAFHNLPIPPGGQGIASEGGPEAMQVVFVTTVLPDSVLQYYRAVLAVDPFHLINERKSGKSTALYAEQENGPPIWVTVSPNGSEGSQVILAGARDTNRVDSVTRGLKTADSGASATLPIKKP